jgi:hypothetical protein
VNLLLRRTNRACVHDRPVVEACRLLHTELDETRSCMVGPLCVTASADLETRRRRCARAVDRRYLSIAI